MFQNSLKDELKKIQLIYALNASIKSFVLRFSSYRLSNYYKKQFRHRGLTYNRDEATATFKKHVTKLKPNHSSKKKGKLKIFWVGASEAQDRSGFLQALEKCGNVTNFVNKNGSYGPIYEVKGLHWLQVRRLNDEALIEQVSRAQADGSIDFLIGQMWAHIFSEGTLLKVRELGIPIINIAMDDRLPSLWGFKNGERMGAVGLASAVDMTLTTSPEVCNWYKVEAMPSLFWPLASDEKLFFSDCGSTAKDIDILFIGNRYGIRGKLVEFLAKNGISVTCYGNGWPNGYVNAEKNIVLSKRAKIILGVGAIGHCSNIYTLKLRDFDALMTGALYITHRNPDLLEFFEEGVHLECYESPKELLKKITYYLDHPKKCYEIGKSGQILAREKHSWEYRLSSTFKELGFLS